MNKQKKHNISLPRKVLRFMNHYFVKITSSQTSHNSSSWKDSVAPKEERGT